MNRNQLCILLAAVCLALLPACSGGEPDLPALRAECPSNLDQLRMAEMAYHAEWNSFTSAPKHPRPVPDAQQAEWGTGKTPFWNLGWAPDSKKVRGVYWVEATAGGFEAFCEIDADGNGDPARYKATLEGRATLETLNSTY